MTPFDSSHDEHDSPQKQAVARRTSWISGALNIVLAALQVAIGVVSHSQALIADGVHSLADLVADGAVLLATHHSHHGPDEDHQYGHARYENIASLVLGVLLLVVGVGMLWRAGERLASGTPAQAIHATALFIAIVTLVSKELLFRYMLREAERVRSAMLVANAWHARADAASSLVVALGIAGSLAGFTFLDALAASVVGFLVARMGWQFTWAALNDLADAAVDDELVQAMRATLAATPGVDGIHLLRTRKMGDLAFVDAHLIVAPRISVSEGHFIAERARERLVAAHPVLDAVIHIDPEDDEHVEEAVALPDRQAIVGQLEALLDARRAMLREVRLDYLNRRVSVTVIADLASPEDHVALRAALQALQGSLPDIAATAILSSPTGADVSASLAG
ncbi:MAG: cation transporter [Burkholderiales bacterium]|nr:cation transporter [Burkholderiales bacterium]